MSIADRLGKDIQANIRFLDNVKWLVRNNNKSFSLLTTANEREVIGDLLKSLENPYEFLTEHKDSDKCLNYFSSYLQSFNPNYRYDFMEKLVDNAITYYAHDLEMLFEDVARELKEDLQDAFIE